MTRVVSLARASRFRAFQTPLWRSRRPRARAFLKRRFTFRRCRTRAVPKPDRRVRLRRAWRVLGRPLLSASAKPQAAHDSRVLSPPKSGGGAGCVPSSRALDAEAQLQRDVLRAIACVGDKHKTTLPELYLAYTLEFGEELRDALLRVAKEPVNNPKKRTIMDLVEKTKLAEVVEVTRGPAGRFGEAVFFVERRGGKRIKRSDFPTRDRTGTATFATLQHTTRTPVQRPATETHTEKHHRVLSPKPLRKTPSALFLETPGETITPPAFESSHSLSCFTLRGEAICRNQNRSNECQYRW